MLISEMKPWEINLGVCTMVMVLISSDAQDGEQSSMSLSYPRGAWLDNITR